MKWRNDVNSSDIQSAEKATRARSLLMAVMATILLAQTAIGLGDEASSMTPAFRHGLWALMILLWLIVLATGGGLLLSRRVRSVMNDEVALANRSRAVQAGFWAAILVAIGLYFLSLREEISVREALRILVNLSIAAALIRYAWLDLR
jgi:hypothetical protein